MLSMWDIFSAAYSKACVMCGVHEHVAMQSVSAKICSKVHNVPLTLIHPWRKKGFCKWLLLLAVEKCPEYTEPRHAGTLRVMYSSHGTQHVVCMLLYIPGGCTVPGGVQTDTCCLCVLVPRSPDYRNSNHGHALTPKLYMYKTTNAESLWRQSSTYPWQPPMWAYLVVRHY